MDLLTSEQPLVTVDFDGVICSPFFGVNLGISRNFVDPDAPPVSAYVPPMWLGVIADHARFDLRRPLPDARAGLVALSEVARVTILTGRRTSPAAWLRWHRLDRYIEAIITNTGPLRSAHFKLAAVEMLRPRAHIDDDPRTAQLLAQRGGIEVFLRDWPRNRSLRYDWRVTRISTMSDVAQAIRGLDAD
ncbi:MAG: hypothetical protein EXR66_04250 [Dehalococcoidia bacterium]|nr:hypothetical protein [Dehalococcoidia bacterium]